LAEINPILLEVFKNRFSAIAEEMGVVLQKTAFSPNIKERRDFSCAIFNKNGDLIAQASHIPVHLGSMPMSVKSIIQNMELEEGDIAILNNPYKGGTHLPDITAVAPVYYEGELIFYVANRAHHADIGGMSAGSMPIADSIFQEGIIIPPVKLVKKGEINTEILDFIKSNVRTPEEREGDFLSQIMAIKTGIKRVTELIEKYGKEKTLFYSDALINYAEKIMREFIKTIPNGRYSFTDYIEDDGLGNRDIKISVDIEIKDEEIVIDFSKSDKQVKGSVNAVKSITYSAILYVFRSLIGEDIPTNYGIMKPIKLITSQGSIVDCKFPSPVSAGNVETSQRIVDVLLGALAEAIPLKVPAASQGTMNNLTIGGIHPETGKPFTYYETLGGGMGASAVSDGESAIQSHMTNTLNTPIEALEFEYPFLITSYKIRKNSGGNGLKKGGDGLIREYKFLTDVEVTMISERRRLSPYGLFGGENGISGKNYIIRDGKLIEMESKFNTTLKLGDKLCIKTPGGGGYGKVE
jgi:N-methylhydantoinase B